MHLIADTKVAHGNACDIEVRKEGDTAGGEKGNENLCSAFASCNECIAGLQKNRGLDEGQAQTECSMAASGCWTTWEKPVVCGDEEKKE